MRFRGGLVSLFVVLLLLIASCGGGDDGGDSANAASGSASATTDDDTEADAGDAGEVDDDAAVDSTEPPAPDEGAAADDGRTIVALDEQATFALLSLGVEPDVVLTTLSSETFARLNEDLGIEAIEFVIAEPSFEVLAGLQPDLLVGIGSPWVVDRLAEYEQIAPVVTAPTDGSWQEQLTAFADALDVGDRAEAVVAAVDRLEAETTADLAAAGADGTSVSLLTVRVGNILAINSGGATGELLLAAGLTRPEPQQGQGAPGIPFDFISEEVLAQHDADLLLLPKAAIFDIEPLVTSPVYEQLPVVQAGATHEVVADAWVLGGHGFAAFWLLEDLRALLIDGAEPATLDDTETRWQAFLDTVG